MELQSRFYSEHGHVSLTLFSDKFTAPKIETLGVSRRLLEDIKRVYNNCCENSNLTSYSYPNHFDANRFRAQSLYDINQIQICFLRSKLISNSFSMKM